MKRNFLSPSLAVAAVAVFGAGALSGMWLFSKVILGSHERDGFSESEEGEASRKLSQRELKGREVEVLERMKQLFEKSLTAKTWPPSFELADEELAELISPDEVPDILEALLQRSGVLGLPRFVQSHFREEGDLVILRELLRFYYTERKEEALVWMHGLGSGRDRKLMTRMLLDDFTQKAGGSYYDHTIREGLLDSLRPLAGEFPSAFDSWVVSELNMYSSRGLTGGFVDILQFEEEFKLGALRGDWSMSPIGDDFDFIQVLDEFARINTTLSPDEQMSLPRDFHDQWERRDAEGARAWRLENPNWKGGGE